MADIVAITTLTIIFAVSCLYFLSRKKRSQSIEQIKDPVTGRTRLRIFEHYLERGKHDKVYLFGEAQLVNVVFLESTVPLKKTHLVTALVALANKHPYLRMKCEWGQHSERYLTEMDQFTENELLYFEENDDDDWVNRFEQELQRGHDLAHGPLWRVVRIRDNFDSSTNKYTSTLLFSFNHAISDEMSVLTFLDQLLEILDQLHRNTFDIENMPRLELLPPLLDLVKHHTSLSWWDWAVMRYNAKIQSFKGFKNSFLDLFPPPMVDNPSMIQITRVIPGSLSQHQTALLVKNCKTNNCTVTGALAVCLSTALFEMAEECGKELNNIGLGFPVNVRKGCQPVVSDDDIGLFIGIIFLRISKYDNCFWDQTREISCGIKQQLSENNQYGVTTRMRNGVLSQAQAYSNAKKNNKYAGRYPNFELTNCGRFSVDKNRVHTVSKLHFAVSQDVIGPIATMSTVTVNGQLNWTVFCGNAAICEENISRFSKLFDKSITELCCTE